MAAVSGGGRRVTAVAATAQPSGAAILIWGNVIEDWLGPLSLSVDDFVERMDGGWIFGYCRALEVAGFRPVVLCVSGAVRRPERRRHRATGATVWLLPPPRTARLVRWLHDPYAWNPWVGIGAGRRRKIVGVPLWLIAPYLSTPVVALTRALRYENCEVLICQEYEEGRFDLVFGACRLAGIRIFATYQGGNHCRTPVERFVRPRTVRAADGLLVGPGVERDRIEAAYAPSPDRVHDVPNPVELPPPRTARRRAAARRALGLDTDDVVVSYLGRIDVWQKGLDVLVDAWRRCVDARPERPLRLLILGSGRDSAQLKDLIAERQASGVHWRDEFVLDRSIVARYHHASDVFVHPSRHEGFAVAPAEAMAAGLPVVVSDAPGMVELLGEERAGVMVPQGDPEALADALGTMIDDLESARKLGIRARKRVGRRFATSVVGAQLESVLRPGASRKTGPPLPAGAARGAAGAPCPADPPAVSGHLPVSVVVPTVGRRLLEACLKSVLACQPGPSEVVVLDQSHGLGIPTLVRSLGDPRLRVLEDRGRGIARATNAGIAHAAYRTVLVTHDDCTVAGDWIATGSRLLADHPGALLTGRVLPSGGSPYVPSTIDDPDPRDWTGTVCAGQLYPANMVLDRDELLAFGGFDERESLRFAAEDNDLNFRWVVAGGTLRYEPALVVWHHDWRTPAELIKTHITYARGQGAFYAKQLVAREWRVLPLLRWDLVHGFTSPLSALLRRVPRWQEPYWEMNLSLVGGMFRALPEALVLERQSRRRSASVPQ